MTALRIPTVVPCEDACCNTVYTASLCSDMTEVRALVNGVHHHETLGSSVDPFPSSQSQCYIHTVRDKSNNLNASVYSFNSTLPCVNRILLKGILSLKVL